MTGTGDRQLSHRDYLDRTGTLIVLRPLPGSDHEVFLILTDDGEVTAFNGHVDLGTGVRTALAQIVAEELDLPMQRVTMVLGDTDRAPNQGPTIASETIQVAAVPLRRAAAQARHFLLQLAAAALGTSVDALQAVDGGIRTRRQGDRAPLSFASLLKGRKDRLVLDDAAPVKAVADYRIVGRSVQRVDLEAKATGADLYVHDVRLPSMLHGRVIRPPYAGLDSGAFVGTSLRSVEESSLAGLAGIVALVVIRDFVGVVAEREEQAAAAADRLVIHWQPGPPLPALDDLEAALTAHPGTARTLMERGDVDRELSQAAHRLRRTYVWPYQLHASIGPSCAVADYRDGALTVWSGTQNPLPLRADLALLLGLAEARIRVLRLEASGCYGRNCADDVAADAALLSRAVGRPVRVQLTREQEHLWEPKGAAQVMQVDGGLRADGVVAGYDFATRYPSNDAPTLALLLTGTIPPLAAASDMGDRTAIPPYAFEHLRVTAFDMAPIVRASWLRGVSALPNCFAHECYLDELAAAARVDPVAFRLQHLDDARAIELIGAVTERAQWRPRTEPRRQELGDRRRQGQGFAYAQYRHGTFPGTAAAWSAWVAEVEVDLDSGEVQVSRVVVGQDAGLLINPAGAQHQVHGNVLQSISRTLHERVHFDSRGSTSREWGAYPILTFPQVPVIQVIMMPRAEEPPLGVGESASVPSAAAIANAIFDATGVRLREPPFTPERMRDALRAAAGPADTADVTPASALAAAAPAAAAAAADPRLDQLRALAAPPQLLPRPAPVWRRIGRALGAAVGLVMAALLWRTPLAPVAAPDPEFYSAQAVARGAELAGLGNCAVCHTHEGGLENAGGRPLETPFGVIYTSNITPDPATGIGNWSFAAFERAMRQGLHRDGRHLYPAFPYTAFAKTSDHDLQALYAYLMSRPPVGAPVPAPRLRFPFNQRALVGLWNALFLRTGEFAPDPDRSTLWNRGAYLTEGLGHCSACHSPRNAWGAEVGGSRHWAGGRVDGWDAPPLTAASHAPIPWSEAELFRYLRTGASRFHGAAVGPMQPVIAGLAALPDSDLHAMAHYIGSFNAQLAAAQEAELAQRLSDRSLRARPAEAATMAAGARLFEGACASCHDPQDGSLAASRPSLALNTNLHGPTATNVARAILDGVNAPALGHLGAMPAFRRSFDDAQLADLLVYLRARFAPDQPAWTGVSAAALEVRSTGQPRVPW
jgi:nicotinate dehydrogenase subunit B